jgi:hypothetical protein
MDSPVGEGRDLQDRGFEVRGRALRLCRTLDDHGLETETTTFDVHVDVHVRVDVVGFFLRAPELGQVRPFGPFLLNRRGFPAALDADPMSLYLSSIVCF